MKCQHVFHFDCIWKWLEFQKHCPLCRKRVSLSTSDILAASLDCIPLKSSNYDKKKLYHNTTSGIIVGTQNCSAVRDKHDLSYISDGSVISPNRIPHIPRAHVRRNSRDMKLPRAQSSYSSLQRIHRPSTTEQVSIISRDPTPASSMVAEVDCVHHLTNDVNNLSAHTCMPSQSSASSAMPSSISYTPTSERVLTTRNKYHYGNESRYSIKRLHPSGPIYSPQNPRNLTSFVRSPNRLWCRSESHMQTIWKPHYMEYILIYLYYFVQCQNILNYNA